VAAAAVSPSPSPSPSGADARAARLIAALQRRRARGEVVEASGVGAAVADRASSWDVRRALCAGDPLLDELGVPAALADAGAEVVRWPDARAGGWRELLGLEGPTATLGVTVPALAVAERGTLVLSSSPGHGRSIDVVSRRHLAVLPASRIRDTLAEALAERYGASRGERPPSAVSLVSGPSRTSDIEKISTLGAHGALSMDVLVIADM
jgi:L-lactate utilization protein LutC